MEETGKAGKKSNIEINADKGAKQNSHPGREEWPHLIRIGVMVFVTFAVSILFFFALYIFEGFAGIWSKLLAAAMPIIMGLVLAYLMKPPKISFVFLIVSMMILPVFGLQTAYIIFLLCPARVS